MHPDLESTGQEHPGGQQCQPRAQHQAPPDGSTSNAKHSWSARFPFDMAEQASFAPAVCQLAPKVQAHPLGARLNICSGGRKWGRFSISDLPHPNFCRCFREKGLCFSGRSTQNSPFLTSILESLSSFQSCTFFSSFFSLQRVLRQCRTSQCTSAPAFCRGSNRVLW